MLKNIRKIQRISIQSYLTTLLISLVIIQAVVILTTLVVKDFYSQIDEQILDNFITRSDQQITDVNEKMTLNVKHVMELSNEVTSKYTNEAKKIINYFQN